MIKRKIIFMGTPDFAVPALKKLAGSGHEIVAVYTAPPKPAGRGKNLSKSAVHLVAETLNLQVLTPALLKNEVLPPSDFAVVAAYGLLLPEQVLNAPKFGCINIHPSLLPRWRGAAPIQRTIMAGDEETAVCLMKMDKGLDTGDVLSEKKFAVGEMTAGELHDKCAGLGAEMVLDVIANIENIKPSKQSEQGVTYAKKITREDEKINWAESAESIKNKIRGLNPYPGAYFEYNGEKIKVLKAEVVEKQGKAGNVLNDNLTIACGKNALQILELQRPGKKAMNTREFLNGNKIVLGTVLN